MKIKTLDSISATGNIALVKLRIVFWDNEKILINFIIDCTLIRRMIMPYGNQNSFASLNTFWKLKGTCPCIEKKKEIIILTQVKYILLFGCERLYTSRISTKMQIFVNRYLREILKVKYTKKMSSESV